MPPAESRRWLRKGKKGIINSSWEGGFVENENRRVNIYIGGEEGTEVFVTNTPIYVSDGWDNTPDFIKKIAKPMLIVRRKCKSTKFIVVHQLANLSEKFKVDIKNMNIEIMTDDYIDLLEFQDDRILLTSK